MKVLFIHQNFPAQFGRLASFLKDRFGWECTFVTKWKGETDVLPMIKYEPVGSVTKRVHFLSRNFETCTRSALGVYQALKRSHVKPEVIVAHSGFGTTAFLRELFDCPIVNLFEFFYRSAESGESFRPDFPTDDKFKKRLRFLNGMILLDLHEAAAGYAPTHFQRNQFPKEYLPKIETLFDGVDARVFKRQAKIPRVIKGRTIPDNVKIVTYVSRGFESMRGYDIFVRTAKRIYAEFSKVLFVCVGSDRVCYGGDLRFIKEKTFRAHVDKIEQPDPDKFFYTGVVPTAELVRILTLSDVHIYFTVPFVLSWSLINAMACSCKIVSCRVGPVEEAIAHGQSGLLADFHDVDSHARHALAILKAPEEYAHLGRQARQTVEDKYSFQRTVPNFARMIGRVTGQQIDLDGA